MITYIGTKIVDALPMTRGDYNTYRGWDLPGNEAGTDEGYLVEYLDGGESNHANHTGYISWSPKAQFEKAYRPTSGMTFGLALEALQAGKRVARSGWNGKDMWLSLSGKPGENRRVPAEAFWSPNNYDYANSLPGRSVEVLPCVTMKTATGEILMGWLASQTDMFATDWQIV